jgi:hypothetical protein
MYLYVEEHVLPALTGANRESSLVYYGYMNADMLFDRTLLFSTLMAVSRDARRGV